MGLKCNVLPKEYYVIFQDDSVDIIKAESMEKAKLLASAKYDIPVDELRFKLKGFSTFE